MEQQVVIEKTVSDVPVGKKTKTKVLKIVAIVLVVICVILGVVFYFTRSIVLVARGQWDALNKGDVTAAYYQYTTEAFREASSFEAYKQFADQLRASGLLSGAARFSVSYREIKNNQGLLKGNIVLGKQLTPFEYRLRKENGSWRIEYMVIDFGRD
ncbi:MAG: hypothetical protein UX61_C0025G0008 [Parcubacteria group bacterium GW2011_GWA2_46_7]|nr:MAG: hypothetical protein UX15_C0039G0006 [Parcubacteria group bacterium GW2011_GWA1_45_7]KKU10164.1 MAG: hypothetical protein UX14_C0024G0011 [Parcubacteria group bacterium GW2011_GWF1_45_5]KKU43281.1 MAG: hypothetical protein UX61_C0025G0008 [Parcubacteria group bacterium GW2011_GWA2_46_7]KKU46835.1 MAG: hypothetical protein UX66_C0032G0005 [Parcubacteria group bacterium GW2011_GWF2_46_8]OHD12230.1 MAG: hypothetical protein A2Z96_03735 [Spirochaetes bacterium GWB1_48_6]